MLFSISSDSRVRVELRVEKNGQEFIAEVLVDPGDTDELYLPARKILQLGLIRATKTITSRSTHSTIAEHYRFEDVQVFLKFSDGEKIHEYDSFLSVHCLKNEYDEEFIKWQTPAAIEETESYSAAIIDEDTFNTPPIVEPMSPISTVPNKLIVKLSPVTHRPVKNRKQRVSLGMLALRKLELYIDCKAGILEHKEDHIEYEY